MHGPELFERVVEMTGVSTVLAPGMVRRALVDGRADPATAGPASYLEALPRLRARLKAYVTEVEADRRIAAIEAFLTAQPKRPAAVPVDLAAFAEDAKDFTTQGRRWTADELAQIRAAREKAAGEKPGDGS